MTKISVIVPVYNSEEYIWVALASIFDQTLKDIEIICVDDGSTDNSKQLVLNAQITDNRIKYIYQKNQGPGVARNLGISIAQGEFIAFLDSDDEYTQNCSLELLYTKAKENNVMICGGSVFDPPGMVSNRQFFHEGLYDFAEYQCDFWFCRYIYNRQFLMDNRVEFPVSRYYEDPVFLLKAMSIAKSFYAVCEPVYTQKESHTSSKPLSVRQQIDYMNGLFANIELANKMMLRQIYKDNAQRFKWFQENYHLENNCIDNDEYLDAYNKVVSSLNWKSVNKEIKNEKRKENRLNRVRYVKLLPNRIVKRIVGDTLYQQLKKWIKHCG